MARIGKNDNFSIGFKRRFDKLKADNPFDKAKKLYEIYDGFLQQERAAFREWMEFNEPISFEKRYDDWKKESMTLKRGY